MRPAGRRAGRCYPSARIPPHQDIARRYGHRQPAHARREDLGHARRRRGAGRARNPRRRPPPRPRGDQPAGVHRAARPRAHGAPPRQDRRHGRPLDADHAARPADDRHAGRRADQPARGELPRVRGPDPRVRQRHAGDRPRHRAGARAHPARHDDRVRRLAHRHPRGVRGARVRDRHQRGRDGPRDADAAAAQAEDLRGQGRREAGARGQRQGHHPRADRPDRDRRGHGPRVRVPGRGDPRADDGAADDDLQHEHRGRRTGRPDRARRHDVRVSPRPPSRAAGRGLGRGGRRLAHAADRRRSGVRQGARHRREGARADGHLGQQPGHGRAGLGPPASPRGRPRRPDPAGPRARVRVHGADAGRSDRRPPGGRGVHRQLHQQPDQRPAPGRVASSRTARRPTGCG